MSTTEVFLLIGLTLSAILALIACYDLLQKKHTIWHNYPLVGRLRFLIEKFGPELRQYIVENNREGLPFNRSQRMYVYASAKQENNNEGFGSDKNFSDPKHFFIKSALFPVPIKSDGFNAQNKIIGLNRRKPFLPNRFVNISGMSFGALSGAAVDAMNKGAKLANCYHTTGEGGLSEYHKSGADVVFQFGTGYNGVCDSAGNFSMPKLIKLCEENPFIKMIEVKLHQGAKPGAWSILPKSKMTEEIRITRGLEPGQDSISPGYHSAFSNSMELITFIEDIADKTGLPVGIKCGVGKLDEWDNLAELIKLTGKGPDYIVIDGGEGGTGSAKGSFVDHVGLPFLDAFSSVYKIFLEKGIADKITWIGSGKLGFPAQVVLAMAMGCDLINIGREAMLSIGCIQAQQCHLNTCPTGIATQNHFRQRGLDPNLKSVRFANYLIQLEKDTLAITAASGYDYPNQFTTEDISLNSGDSKSLVTLKDVYGYTPIKSKRKQFNFR